MPSGLSEGIQSGRICAGRAQDCSSGSHLGRKGERPLNIVQIVTRTDSIGGAQVHVRDLALGLIRDGHQVTVLAGGTGPFAKELEAHNIRYQPLCHLVRPIRPLTDLRALIELRSALKSIGPDLVATHSSKAGWLGRLAARSLNMPVVFTAHGWAFTDGVPEKERRLFLMAERLAGRLADRIITVSEFDRSLALRYGVASEDKVVAVHNGVADVAEGLLARADCSPPHIIMVARFDEQKDHRTLLRALARLSELPWTLELVGDGGLRPHMEALAAQLGIADRVRFAGVSQAVAERLARAQLFVLISRWEGFPLTILEAMRAGLPVVASDVGGVREAVVDGETGFLVPREDVDALAKRLRTLILDASLRRRMGGLGRQRFLQEFTFERMYRKTLQVYEDALRTRRRTFRT